MAKTNHKCNDFKTPSSLKELLDFFAKFKVDVTPNGQSGTCSDVKDPATKAIFDEIRKRLIGKNKDGWVRDGPNPFCTNTNANGTASMFYTIAALNELCKNILKDPNNNLYDNIATQATDPCIKKYADAILSNAFPLFGCLFYLWFMCDNGANTIKKNGTSGGNFTGWKEQKLDGNGGSDGHLNKFLTDDPSIKTNNKFSMLTRGFKDAKLNGSNQGIRGETIFNHAEKLFDIGSNDTTGQLQNVLFFLLFLAPSWYPAMSGHALLFLEWFNEKASQAPFNDLQWCHVKGAGTTFFGTCTRLTEAIKKLAEGSNGNGANISPVYKVSIDKNGYGHGCNLYSPGEKSKCKAHPNNNGGCGQTILHNTSSFKDNDKKAHVFMQYVSWLWWCIPHLTASLKEMSADSSKWDKEGTAFKNCTSFGPFPWGFTFTNEKWNTGNNYQQLQKKLQQLIDGIEHFRDRHIGAFFWAIRRPFAMGSLAAWILSFTFLLYVNLLPLDLFHIQSHYNVFSFSRGLIRPLDEVSYFSRV